MSAGFTDEDFKELVKRSLLEARESAKTVVLRDELPSQINEYGDEFGDALGDVGWKDFTKVIGDPGKVKDAIVGSALKAGTRAHTLLSVIVRGIPSLIIPFIKTKYDRIYARERTQLGKIKQKYPDVFRNADKVFTDDGKLVAFMVNPVMMLAAVAATATPSVVLGLADALGGDEAVSSQIKRVWQQIKRVPQHAQGREPRASSFETKPRGNEDLYYEESREATLVLEADKAQRDVAKFIRSAPLQQLLSKSPVVQKLKSDAENIKNEALNATIDLATDIRQMDDIKALQRLDSNLARDLETKTRGLKPDEADAIIQASIKEIKDASIAALVKRVETQIKEFQKLRIPESSELISAYQKTLKAIQSTS